MNKAGFYQSARWRALRLIALRRDRWHCVICGSNVSGKGQARVDHILPVATHPALALVIDNLRTLCTTCDAQGHREKGMKTSTRHARFDAFNANGEPLDPSHHWHRK
jgi:5-methylcytosine-specific restriction endonuclease McrA